MSISQIFIQLEDPYSNRIQEHNKVLNLSIHIVIQVSSVQSLSHVRLFATPWTAAGQASLSITNSWSLLKTHVH